LSLPRIRVATNNWDHLAPLACGDVKAEGVELQLDRFAPLTPAREDPEVQACEQSLSQYLLFDAQRDLRWVGLPIFLMRCFRHRSFYVQRDSALKHLTELSGKRVGISGWPDTGNTWARAALRAAGVQTHDVSWLLGPVDDPNDDAVGHRPAVALSTNVLSVARGQCLRQMLLDGQIDAIVCPKAPRGMGEADSPIRRLLADYERDERAYAHSLGFCPAHHLLALRREVFEGAPWIARALYAAFDESKLQWMATRTRLSDSLPWLDTQLESMRDVLGTNWQPYGLRANGAMLRTLADEQYAQGLHPEPIDPIAAFADFAGVLET
jgi:4,5-dihydroxyphthalate decarboxylase